MHEFELPGILRKLSEQAKMFDFLSCEYEKAFAEDGCVILNDAADIVERLLDERIQAVMDAGIGCSCYSCKRRKDGRELIACKDWKPMSGPEMKKICGNWLWRGLERRKHDR